MDLRFRPFYSHYTRKRKDNNDSRKYKASYSTMDYGSKLAEGFALFTPAKRSSVVLELLRVLYIHMIDETVQM